MRRDSLWDLALLSVEKEETERTDFDDGENLIRFSETAKAGKVIL